MDFGEFTIILQAKGIMSIATSLDQSKRLLELGIKPETADMVYLHQGTDDDKTYYSLDCHPWDTDCGDKDIPAWSLFALLNLMPVHLITDKIHLRLRIDKGMDDCSIWYEDLNNGYVYNKADFTCDNPIDAAVEMIEWLVKNKYLEV